MNSITLHTRQKPIQTFFSNIWNSPDDDNKEIGCMVIQIGDMDVNIRFDTADEMIQFCTQHNFPYKDQRKEKKNEQQAEES